ncbi:hypothetical protein [Vibrio phage vB_VmeM-Yong XC32]|nr:hypothetical protein [Vibrio phage vB_VmeM-Yong XC31]QAX96547.1 hypothetical protein [Vibrio phage vB_VmeM-Yong XC32]QAX96865.1 hypothetical protein [Vibrio phage vB_VmeM-Yong MS31]QAX97170.1 hypothetical protein [Vibrio phage vB_VmeM-Yong MS32]
MEKLNALIAKTKDRIRHLNGKSNVWLSGQLDSRAEELAAEREWGGLCQLLEELEEAKAEIDNHVKASGRNILRSRNVAITNSALEAKDCNCDGAHVNIVVDARFILSMMEESGANFMADYEDFLAEVKGTIEKGKDTPPFLDYTNPLERGPLKPRGKVRVNDHRGFHVQRDEQNNIKSAHILQGSVAIMLRDVFGNCVVTEETREPVGDEVLDADRTTYFIDVDRLMFNDGLERIHWLRGTRELQHELFWLDNLAHKQKEDKEYDRFFSK